MTDADIEWAIAHLEADADLCSTVNGSDDGATKEARRLEVALKRLKRQRDDAVAALDGLRNGIQREIDRNYSEAKAHREAQSDAADAGGIEEALIHEYEARAHETVAERLSALLPKRASEEIAF